MFLLFFVTSVAITSVSAQTLNVTLYYESLCPYSRHFIIEQLYPAYEQIGDYLNIDYIPFGFANGWKEADGSWNFTCQHGPNECYGNRVQSCVIEKYSGNPKNKFIDCAMSDGAGDDEVLQKCATDSGVSWDSIEDCLETGLADQLLVENGNRTDAATPPVVGVPTVVFNGVYNEDLDSQAYFDFLDTACQLLNPSPEECS